MTEISSKAVDSDLDETKNHKSFWEVSRRSFVQTVSALFVSPSKVVNIQVDGLAIPKLISELSANQKGLCTTVLFDGITKLCSAVSNLEDSLSNNFGIKHYINNLASRVNQITPEESLSLLEDDPVNISNFQYLANDYNALVSATNSLSSLPIWENFQSLILDSNFELMKTAKSKILQSLKTRFLADAHTEEADSSTDGSSRNSIVKKLIKNIDTKTNTRFLFDDLEDFLEELNTDEDFKEEYDLLDNVTSLLESIMNEVSKKQTTAEAKILEQLGLSSSTIQRFKQTLEEEFGQSFSKIICSRPKRFLPDINHGDAELEPKLLNLMGENSNIFNPKALSAYQEQLMSQINKTACEYNEIVSNLKALQPVQAQSESHNLDLNQSFSSENLQDESTATENIEDEIYDLNDYISESFFDQGYEVFRLDQKIDLSEITAVSLADLAKKLQLKVTDLQIFELCEPNLTSDDLNTEQQNVKPNILLLSNAPIDYQLIKNVGEKLDKRGISGALVKGDALLINPHVFNFKIRPGSMINGSLAVLYIEDTFEELDIE